MIVNADFFTTKELKIRKQWLISMFSMIGFTLLQAVAMSFNTPKPLRFFGLGSLFMLVFFGLLYHFSYKKNGYQMLQMTLLYPLIRMSENASKFKSRMQIEDTTDLVILLIILLVYGWWYFTSIKLIMLNIPLNPSRKCKKAIAQMQTAQTIEDLDLKFNNLKNEFPKFERVITKVYDEKKESLINVATPIAISQPN